MSASRMKETHKGFGFWTGWFLVLASMVGSGILTNSGPILKLTQSYPALIALWVAGGFLALLGALSMAELASGISRVGGDYVFVREAFGSGWGFAFGTAMGLFGFAAPLAVVAFATATYLYPALQGLGFSSSWPYFPEIAATLLILLFSLFHSVSHRHSSFLQAATTLFKIAILVGFAIAGFLSPGGDFAGHWRESLPLTSPSLGQLSLGFILVMYAYSGWNASVYIAGETRAATKSIPRSLIWGCVSVAALYLVMNLLYTYALSSAEVQALNENESSLMAQVAMSKLLGENWGRLFSFLSSLGALASVSAYVLIGPRVLLAMAQDGVFPQFAGRLHSRSALPVRATACMSALAIGLLWSGTFEEILEFTSYGIGCLSLLMVAPIFILRKRPDFTPLFRTPYYPLPPLLFIVISLALLIGGATEKPLIALTSLAVSLIGWPIYWITKRA